MRSDNHEETLNFLSAQPLVQLDELGGPVLLARGHSRADAHSRCQRIMRGRADRTGAETQASGTMVGFAAGQRRAVLWVPRTAIGNWGQERSGQPVWSLGT